MSTISAQLTEGFAVDLRSTSGHTWSSDEPTGVGGTNTGPNPYELLLGSLAACTSITVSMYAQRKGWKVDRIEVDYEHDRVHVEDCVECEDHQKGYIDRIVSHVRIHGELNDTQRDRLAHVAANCPVHKTLEKGVHLVDHVTFG